MKDSELNYQHLRYFRTVALEGSVLKAARVLHLAPSTVSGQVKALEAQLGQRLLMREGRALALTEFGQRVLDYANPIFELGEELVRETVLGERRQRVRVGVASGLPKLLVRDLVLPACLPGVELHVEHDDTAELLGRLTARQLDVVLSDAPRPGWMGSRGAEHLLIRTGIAVFGTQDLADRVGTDLPRGLARVPWLVPPAGSTLRSGLELWWRDVGLSPDIAAVVDDSGLLKALGDAGVGLFAVPAAMQEAILDAFDVVCIGVTDEVTESVYAITREAEPTQAAVRALCVRREDPFAE